MRAKAIVSDKFHTLIRKNPATGYIERMTFVGPLYSKPKGWKVDKASTKPE